jgi:hypothetical protein
MRGLRGLVGEIFYRQSLDVVWHRQGNIGVHLSLDRRK